MSLKSRRGSHNLKFGEQTIPDAGGSNSKRPIADLSPSPPNDQVAAAWWSQWWPRTIACRRCQQFSNIIRYLANKRLVYQNANFVVNTRSNRQPMQLAKGRSHVITWSQADHNPCCHIEDSATAPVSRLKVRLGRRCSSQDATARRPTPAGCDNTAELLTYGT